MQFWGAPVHAYHPSSVNFLKPGKQKLLEIPVSSSIPLFQRWPLRLLRLLARSERVRKSVIRRLGLSQEPLWVRPFRSDPSGLVKAARTILDHWPVGQPAFINVMFHSVEIIPGASPYAATDAQVDLLFESLYCLVTELSKITKLIPVTLSEFPR